MYASCTMAWCPMATNPTLYCLVQGLYALSHPSLSLLSLAHKFSYHRISLFWAISLNKHRPFFFDLPVNVFSQESVKTHSICFRQQHYSCPCCYTGSVTIRLRQFHHRLRGSASPVLTATGFVNGKGQFSTSTESTPLNRSPKHLSQVIMSATPTAVPN